MIRRGGFVQAALAAWIGASCVVSPSRAVATGYREGNDPPPARIARAAVCTFPDREDRTLGHQSRWMPSPRRIIESARYTTMGRKSFRTVVFRMWAMTCVPR